MTTIEILKAARAKIEKPENWCKGTFATDGNHLNCRWASADAVSFCAEGALYRIEWELLGYDSFQKRNLPEIHEAAYVLCKMTPGLSIQNFNDAGYTNHGHILAMFDLAIASLETP